MLICSNLILGITIFTSLNYFQFIDRWEVHYNCNIHISIFTFYLLSHIIFSTFIKFLHSFLNGVSTWHHITWVEGCSKSQIQPLPQYLDASLRSMVHIRAIFFVITSCCGCPMVFFSARHSINAVELLVLASWEHSFNRFGSCCSRCLLFIRHFELTFFANDVALHKTFTVTIKWSVRYQWHHNGEKNAKHYFVSTKTF